MIKTFKKLFPKDLRQEEFASVASSITGLKESIRVLNEVTEKYSQDHTVERELVKTVDSQIHKA